MLITLNHTEITDAVTKYIGSKVVLSDDVKVEVTLTAGRGSNGYTATVDIIDIVKEIVEIEKTSGIPKETADAFLESQGIKVEDEFVESPELDDSATEEPDNDKTEIPDSCDTDSLFGES